jgi:hypothetical protein
MGEHLCVEEKPLVSETVDKSVSFVLCIFSSV